ncbi:MAG: 4-hydroxy-tetrahydrodipicolinate synthase [Candidatus Helarchaeota archaeon]
MIEGIITAIITPFYKNLEINYNLLEELTKFQERNGISGLVPCGTNGEYPSLTVEESKKIIKTVVNTQKNLFIVAGVGRASIKETIELAKYSDGLCDAIMIGVPFYFKPVPEIGLYNFYSKVLESVECSCFLYNIPRFTGIPITIELMKKLSKFENLAGIKDSSGNIFKLKDFISNFPNLGVFSGSDALIYQGLKSGTKGGVSALGNIFPKKVMKIFNSFKQNDLQTAEKVQHELIHIRSMFKKLGSIAIFKKWIKLHGFDECYVRPPLNDLSEEEFNGLLTTLKNLNFKVFFV